MVPDKTGTNAPHGAIHPSSIKNGYLSIILNIIQNKHESHG